MESGPALCRQCSTELPNATRTASFSTRPSLHLHFEREEAKQRMRGSSFGSAIHSEFKPIGHGTSPLGKDTRTPNHSQSAVGYNTSIDSLDSVSSDSSDDSYYEQLSSSENIPRVLLRRSRQSIRSARLPKDVGMCGQTTKQLLHMRMTLPPELRRMLCDHCLHNRLNLKPKRNPNMTYLWRLVSNGYFCVHNFYDIICTVSRWGSELFCNYKSDFKIILQIIQKLVYYLLNSLYKIKFIYISQQNWNSDKKAQKTPIIILTKISL